MEQPLKFYFKKVLHSYRGKDTSPSHDVSWQTAHNSNNVYQQIHGLVSQCTLQGKSSLTAYLSVCQIQHCNTRPSGGFSEKTQGKIPPSATNCWKESIMGLLCSLSQHQKPRIDCATFICIHLKNICCSNKSRGSEIKIESWQNTAEIYSSISARGGVCISYTCICSLQMS